MVRRVILALFSLLFCLLSFSFVYASEPFEFHVLDVGQGLCVLIKAENSYMLIDGGGRDASSFVISYLKQQGIEKMDCVALTHYDEDHMAGVVGVLNVFSCDRFIAPSYEGNGELYQALAVAALSNQCEIIHGKAGMELSLGDASVSIIGPIKTDYSLDNDQSLCFLVSFGNNRFMVCGDAEQASEMDLVGSGLDLSADLYVVNHHGSSTSSMDRFLDSLYPTYAVISCGRNNDYGHPSMETMQRLQNHGISLFRTDDQGTIIAFSNGTDLWFNMEPSDNWNSGSGTVIPLEIVEQENEPITDRNIQEQDQTARYVCNTNTKKFHYPDCKSVNQMKEENRLYTELSRDELIAEGYEPCGNCNP